MNAAVQQQIHMIPLNRLQRSPRNVRTTGGEDVTDLVASIAAHGLLQNLQVVPANGGYAVAAGSRRLAALKQLAKDQRIDADFMVPCLVLPEETASETSLAENTVREPMHPADQFIAFSRLVDEGRSVGDIAARFGVSEVTVQQRLKLAHVAPSLIEIYRTGAMTLEQLMAFTVTDDLAAQERHWQKADRWERNPQAIKNALTKGEIDSTRDPRARYVGLAQYEQAGGVVRRDLFGGDDAGFVKDGALLNKLAKEKLEQDAERVRKEGWSWVEARLQFDYNARAAFDQIEGTKRTPTDTEEKATLARMNERLAELDKALGGGIADPDEFDTLSEERVRLRLEVGEVIGRLAYSAEQRAVLGAVVTVDGASGHLLVHRGLLRAKDKDAARKAGVYTRKDAPAKSSGKSSSAKTTKGKPGEGKLERALLIQLVAATRAELAQRPDIALVVAVHGLLLEILFGYTANEHSPVVFEVFSNDLKKDDDSIHRAPAYIASQKTVDDARKQLPKKSMELWAWLLQQKQDALLQLLAVAIAQLIDFEDSGAGSPAPGPMQKVAAALGLDMTRWWKPTVANYLGKVSKDQVLEALKEAGLAADAHRLGNGKPAAIAAEAEKLLGKTTWLPKLLRTCTPSPMPATKATATKKPKAAAPKKPAAKPAKKAAKKGARK